MGGDDARLPHRPALDGLRGLAVLGVLAYHLGFGWAKGGFLGVSLFFTLSGFLITNLLLAKPSLTGFWGRRARRLLPAAFAGILLAIVVVAVAGTTDQVARLPGDVAGASLYAANWRFIIGHNAYAAGFQAPSPLLHYWSLAIEEQAYLVLPLVVCLLVTRRRLKVAVATLMAASAASTLVLHDVNRIYYGTDTRGFELLAGVLLAAVVGFPSSPRLPRWLGPAALAGTLALWVTTSESAHWLYRGGLWAVSGLSCLLILSALRPGRLGQALSARPLVAVGLRSYGIYVYHWPLLLLLTPQTTGLHGILLDVVRVAATAAVAQVSYRWLELPIRQRRWHLPRRVVAWAPVLPAVAVLAAFAVSTEAAASPVAVASRPIVAETGVAPRPGLRRVLFIGDSLVGQAFPTFRSRLAGWGVESEFIGHGGQSLMTAHGAWLTAIATAVRTFDPDVVVLESCCGNFKFDPPWPGAPDDTPAFWATWRQLAGRATTEARARGAAVLWVLAPPAHTNGWYGPIDRRIPIVNQIYVSLARCTGAGLIDWGVLSGPGRSYAASLAGVQIRSTDGFHFTPAGWSAQADLTLAAIGRDWPGRRVAGAHGRC
jgi:peptidoglycan/LPS O-acetylase OafA/YrhL